MPAEKTVIRKRQQIQQANRLIFLYVAGASAVVGICLVIGITLFQRTIYNEKVLGAKGDSLSTIKKNNSNADELLKSVRVLNTNEALSSVRLDENSAPLRVVLDALPSEANSVALGASLQEKLLAYENVAIENITVQAIEGVESNETGNLESSSEYAIPFSFTVNTQSSNPENLREILSRLERSIRNIKLISYEIEQRGNQITLQARGEAYYQPSANLNLYDEDIK